MLTGAQLKVWSACSPRVPGQASPTFLMLLLVRTDLGLMQDPVLDNARSARRTYCPAADLRGSCSAGPTRPRSAVVVSATRPVASPNELDEILIEAGEGT